MGTLSKKQKTKEYLAAVDADDACPPLTKEAPSKHRGIKETCPSFNRGHIPKQQDVDRLRSLSKPHVESFDYFLEVGLKNAIADIEPSELDLVDPKRDDTIDFSEVDTVQFWVENVTIRAPTKPGGGRLTPRECRELGLMYSGKIQGDFCYRIVKHRNGLAIPDRTIKFQSQFGEMPIMVMSKACHLNGKSPSELATMREEVRATVFFRGTDFCLILTNFMILCFCYSTPSLVGTL
jgi:DNA-directed RNA polymerase beta subunit